LWMNLPRACSMSAEQVMQSQGYIHESEKNRLWRSDIVINKSFYKYV
jgi:hypothetical protein